MNECFEKTVRELAQLGSNHYEYIPQPNCSLPDVDVLAEVVQLCREVVFPGYFGRSLMNNRTSLFHIGVKTERIFQLLSRQTDTATAETFVAFLPELKRMMNLDVKAVFDDDPAADSYEEVIFSYPAIKAIMNYRIAHQLLSEGVTIIPRIITEMAHSETGIDIHPGAQIGEYFSIDHGTGVVIGETCIIGSHVRLYQGVTLGSKNFKYDEHGNILNLPRHPILEDYVTVYSNASILGRITIGHHSVIGGNIWQTTSLPPYSRILQGKTITASFEDGGGI